MNGRGFEIDLNQLDQCEDFTFLREKGFETYETLLTICILSGCDYFKSVSGIGFKTAVKLVQMFGNDLEKISLELKESEKYQIITDQYLAQF